MRRAREGASREGCPPEPPGWLLEARGDARPRGMIVDAAPGDRTRDRTRLTLPATARPRSERNGASRFCRAASGRERLQAVAQLLLGAGLELPRPLARYA